MFRWLVIWVFIAAGIRAYPQDFAWSAGQLRADSLRLASLPPLRLSPKLKTGRLPYRVDHSRSVYFPPIFTQYGWSCNQSSSIAYILTYELNSLRQAPAYREENRLSLFFPWNMLNSGQNNVGVSYFDSWDLVDAAGCPSIVDFGRTVGSNNDDHTLWMSGYPKYYRAMQNRIEGIWSIDIGTEEGLSTLKNWLYDHGGEREPGGLANFQIASGGIQWVTLPPESEDGGKLMISSFASAVGHAMTFVGYNDSVKYDFNRDGLFTNDRDITGDGKVTMLDWEKGALICVNTYGETFGNSGRAYIPYSLLPRYHTNGGIWMRSAVVTRVHKSYKPALGLRIKLSHANRSKLRITAGVSSNPDATAPEHTLDLPIFNYQGGSYGMLGLGSGDRTKIEIGIDASPLLNFVEPGKEAAFFLVIHENDQNNSTPGSLEYAQFIDYTYGVEEYPLDCYYEPIRNGYQSYKVTLVPNHNLPEITTAALPGAVAGQDYRVQLQATGGTPPYRWLPIGRGYREEIFTDTFPSITENRILPVVGNADKATINLPFAFPLYGTPFTRLTLFTTGALMFESSQYTYPYAIDKRKLLALNRAIYPWYCPDLALPQMQDWIYYKADSTCATFRWNASINDNGHLLDVNFAVRLYPSGVVEFYYGPIELRAGYTWFAGLAGGREDFLFYPDFNYTGVTDGLNIRLTPDEYPDGIQLSEGGLLTVKPSQAGKSWTIPVWVEDYNKRRGHKELILQTGSDGIPKESDELPEVKILPNPLTDKGWLSLSSRVSGQARLTLLDATGRTAWSQNLHINPGETLIEVPGMEGLKPGIWYYRVDGCIRGSGKIVKIR